MTSKIKNPFVIGGYVSSEYFCDRETESAELISAFLNERNMVVVSPRRMGKTGLIEHCFNKKEIGREYYTFFIDIYATGTLRELVFTFGKGIFETLKPRGKRFVEQFLPLSVRCVLRLNSIR